MCVGVGGGGGWGDGKKKKEKRILSFKLMNCLGGNEKCQCRAQREAREVGTKTLFSFLTKFR